MQIKEDSLLEFSPFLGFSRVNSCACVRFYLSTSSTIAHHLKWKKNKRTVKHIDINIYVLENLTVGTRRTCATSDLFGSWWRRHTTSGLCARYSSLGQGGGRVHHFSG
jgi:hypothetical protein